MAHFIYINIIKHLSDEVFEIKSHDDFEIKSKIYSLNCLSCFIHILNYKMTLFFGFCFLLYFLRLAADRGSLTL